MNRIPNDPQPADITERSMPELLRELANVRAARIPLSEELAAMQAKEEAIKAGLFAGMREHGVKTGEGSGLVVSVVTTRRAQIVNDDALIDALGRAGVLEDFTRLDRAAAAKYALANGLPGVEEAATQHLRVQEAKS